MSHPVVSCWLSAPVVAVAACLPPPGFPPAPAPGHASELAAPDCARRRCTKPQPPGSDAAGDAVRVLPPPPAQAGQRC